MNFKKVLKLFVIFLIIFGWVFSAWPQLLEFRIKNLEYRVPPEIHVLKATTCGYGSDIGGGQCRGYITSGTTWNVPSDWKSSNNSIEAIGAGGNGGLATGSANAGGGGGGGEYRKAVNVSLTAGSVNIHIPSGGDGSSADGTWVKNNAGTKVVEAKNGGNGSGITAGLGGTGGSGDIGYDGGDGGDTTDAGDTAGAGGGGGGSAGPSGAGKNGGTAQGTTGRGGGGGGGSNGGSSTVGGSSSGSTGGAGGAGYDGTGGGSTGGGDATTEKGGGGGGGNNATGGTNTPGGDGSTQSLWDTNVGPSGGGGGGGAASGANGSGDRDGGVGGPYGGGGGGCGYSGSLTVPGECDGTGVGGQGIIVITYTPSANNPPSLTVSQPDGVDDTVTVGDSYNITYDLSDVEDEATVDFYYDSNDSGLDGTAITGCQDQAEGTGATCAWDTTGMTPDDYYVYGIATDGVNDPVNDYSPGVITINAVIVSVTLDRESFSYGFMPDNTSSSTLTLWSGAGITATNDGNVTEDFDIYGANTANWTLDTSASSDHYIHKFCNDTDNNCTSPPTNYIALTTSPLTLKDGVLEDGTVVFQLQITTPNPSTVYTQQSAVVTVQASQSP